jgi:ectoine hydroxylase-related dioxygenase (phytanoyl-CoA dioxygenase family)
MLARVVELARRAAAGDDIAPAFVMPEEQAGFRDREAAPEELVSKIFRLARDPVFLDFASSDPVVELVGQLIGAPDLDCFLSQFIFKNRGAWGQPWHQDAYYFPFEPARPVVGVWLAVTEATLENGCLHVLPGSHHEPVATHVPDRRPNSNYGYTEIVDRDTSASIPVLMQPGDLLLFDSHLMHRSTDNESDGIRAAMVYHYARAGTVDRTEEIRGYTVNDWMPVRRAS